MSVFSRFPHLKSKSTIEPIIVPLPLFLDEIASRSEEDKASQQPLWQRGVCACVRLFVIKGEVDGGVREGYQDKNVRRNERVISIGQREKERGTLNADTVASQSPLVRAAHENASLRFLLHFYE